MYMSSIVPPFPVGITLNTSRHRQSRNQDGRSLRISATCKDVTTYFTPKLTQYNRVKTSQDKYLRGFQTHEATGSCCYPTTVAGNSNDSNRIRTRLHGNQKMVTFGNCYKVKQLVKLKKGSWKRLYLHPNHLDPVDSSSSSLGQELCQGLLSYCEQTMTHKRRLVSM